MAGERRWRAAQRAGLAVLPAIVERRDDASSLEAAIVENMAREDLNPVEEARAVAALVEELGLTREEVGRRVGRSRVAVSNLLRLLDLPAEVLELLEAGRITEGHGRAVLLAEDQDARRRLAKGAADGGWSVRVTEDRARKANEVQVSRGPGRPAAAPGPGRGLRGDRRDAGARARARGPRATARDRRTRSSSRSRGRTTRRSSRCVCGASRSR